MSSVEESYGLGRKLLPFTSRSGLTPQEFLKEKLDIDPACGLQIVMRTGFDKFPVECSVVSGGENFIGLYRWCVIFLSIPPTDD